VEPPSDFTRHSTYEANIVSVKTRPRRTGSREEQKRKRTFDFGRAIRSVQLSFPNVFVKVLVTPLRFRTIKLGDGVINKGG